MRRLPIRRRPRSPVSPGASGDPTEYQEWRRLPLQPGKRRETCVEEVVRGKLFSFEQQQGVFDVTVNIRMTVLPLSCGLVVVNPIAPTPQLQEMIGSLEKRFGKPVTDVLLTTTQVEHKVYLEPFSRIYPQARIWTVGRQWSFPPFPLSLIGLFPRSITGTLSNDRQDYPWGDELKMNVLDISLPGSIPTPFQEAALFHEDTKTLIVCDSVISVRDTPPAVVAAEPRGLLSIAGKLPKDLTEEESASVDKMAINTPQNRNLGWKKTALLALFLSPSAVSKDLGEYLEKGFVWSEGWQETFKAVSSQKVVVSPLVSELVFKPQREKVKEWAARVAQWPMRRIIGAHFSIAQANSKDFLRAFSFLDNVAQPSIPGTKKDDFEVLSFISKAAFGDKGQ